MTPQEYEELVRKLTDEAERDPKRFERRVLGVISEGYAYLVGVFALTLLGIGICVATIILVPLWAWSAITTLTLLGGLAIVLLNALWVESEPLAGHTIARTEAPALFAEIEAVRGRLSVRRPDEVRVYAGLEAIVFQRPLLGFLGPTRDVLVIGIHLLQALTPEQFRALLAHELGHLAGGHGKFDAWVYQVRRTWWTLLVALERKHRTRGLFASFLERYVPRFKAFTFVLARRQVYVADRSSAEVTSPEVSASALVTVLAADRRLHDLWHAVHARVRTEAEPPRDIISDIGRVLATPAPPRVVAASVEEALKVETGVEDPHPALRDRLSALGVAPEEAMRPATDPERAVSLLGPARAELERRLSAAWRERILQPWRAEHLRIERLEGRRAALVSRPESSLSREEFEELVDCIARLEGETAAEPVVRRLLAAHPDSVRALYWIGTRELRRGDESGLALLAKAADLDEQAVIPAARAAAAFLTERKRNAEAHAWVERAERQQARDQQDRLEHEQLEPYAAFQPHGLPDDVVDRLVALLDERPSVRRAWMVRKHLTIRPEPPHFVLALEMAGHGLDPPTDREIRELKQWLSERDSPLTGSALLIVLTRQLREPGRAIQAVPGSRIL